MQLHESPSYRSIQQQVILTRVNKHTYNTLPMAGDTVNKIFQFMYCTQLRRTSERGYTVFTEPSKMVTESSPKTFRSEIT